MKNVIEFDTQTNPYNGFSQVSVNVPTGSPIIEGTISNINYNTNYSNVSAFRIGNVIVINSSSIRLNTTLQSKGNLTLYTISGLDIPTTMPTGTITHILSTCGRTTSSGYESYFFNRLYYNFNDGTVSYHSNSSGTTDWTQYLYGLEIIILPQ